jgi:hypothetical protein
MPASAAVVTVISRGWHTDIGLSANVLTGPLADLANQYPGARFLTFGFGERNYLLQRRITPFTMLSAMLPSRSALLVTLLSTTPETAFGQHYTVTLYLSQANLGRIQARIWQELQKSAAGKPIWLADGPYPGSEFYGAVDTYFGLYTCNTWTAEMLRAGGLPMPVAGVVFASEVMGMARWISAQQNSLPDR